MKRMLVIAAIAGLPLCQAGRSATTADVTGGRTLGRAHFEIDPDTKCLIVTTDADTNTTVARMIQQLDRPVPQALIKVLFLEVTHGDDSDVGADISYQRESSDGDETILKSIFGASSFTRGGTASILESDLRVTLSALAEISKMEVLSRPSIMARNNEEATITIGSEVPFVRNSQVTDDGRVLNTVEYEDIGIILTVTPHITDDGMVELDVAPEISTLTGESVTISENVEAPTFAKRSAETRVLVPDGRTVVIGGLMADEETEVVRKVPILGNIWGLGALFRRTVKEKTKTELLIFLTPHVVRTGDEVTQLTTGEREAGRLAPEVFEKDAMKRFLGEESDE